jgi:DNA-directed RNA polymerase alpha subunit
MPGVYDDVQMFFLGLKNILQSLYSQQCVLILELNFPYIVLEIGINWDGNLP